MFLKKSRPWLPKKGIYVDGLGEVAVKQQKSGGAPFGAMDLGLT
jgi:hypothetical protein